jgi:hypothetical protein
MKNLLIGIAAMAAALAGCASGGGAAGGDVSGMVVLQQGTHSDMADQAYKDIHNDADLKALWAQVYAKVSSPPPVPQIDWTKQMVLAYFMGEQKHGGYRVSMTKAQEGLGVYNAQATVSIPGQSCHVTMDVTRPYVIVAVPASALPVAFDEPIQKNQPPCG